MKILYYLKKIWLIVTHYRDYWRIIWDRRVDTYFEDLTREDSFLFPLTNLERQRYTIDTMQFKTEDVFLDIGCGAGHVLKAVSGTVKEAWGLDISPRMADFAREYLQDFKSAQIRVGDATRLPFENNKFSKVLCYGVIHYVPRREFARAINELHRVTVPGGQILIGDMPKKNYKWKHKGFKVNRFYFDKTLNTLRNCGKFEITVLKDSPSIFDLLLVKKKMNKRTVCMLTNVHRATDVRIFHKEAKSLVRNGYDVTIIGRHQKNETIDGISIVALNLPGNRFLRFFFGLFMMLRLAVKCKAEVYHFHDPELVFVGLALKLIGKTVVYDAHEDTPKDIHSKTWIRPAAIRKIASCFTRKVLRLGSTFFDRVITATDSIGVNFKGSTVINNFPSCRYASLADRSAHLRTSQVTFIYAGGLSRNHNLHNIAAAAKKLAKELSDIRVVFVGDFEDEKYRREIEVSGQGAVQIRERVPYELIRHVLAEADVGLECDQPAPNSLYSMPHKLFDYMAAGLPIIASNFKYWRDLVEGNGCGLTVNPSDPENIYNVMKKMALDKEKRQIFSQNCKKLWAEKYNWEREEVKLLDLYRSLF